MAANPFKPNHGAIVATNPQGTSLETDSVFEVQSTTEASIPSPKMTTTQRDNLTAVEGFQVWNTTTNALNVYNGTSWDALTPGGLSGSGTTNSVPKWTASSTLGDSSLTDAGAGELVYQDNDGDAVFRAKTTGGNAVLRADGQTNGVGAVDFQENGVFAAHIFVNYASGSGNNMEIQQSTSAGDIWMVHGTTTTQKVGIGTFSPTAKLTVAQNDTTAAAIALFVDTPSTAGTGAKGVQVDHDETGDAAEINMTTAGNALDINHSGAASSAAVDITATGITGSANVLLVTGNNASATGAICRFVQGSSSASSAEAVEVSQASANTAMTITNTNASAGNPGGILVDIANSGRAIDCTGPLNVGIAIIADDDSNGTSNIAFLRFQHRSTEVGNILVTQGTTGLPLVINNTANNVAMVTGGGAVTIGTITPSGDAKLQITNETSDPHLGFVSSVTATNIQTGDMWRDGDALNFRTSSATIDLISGVSGGGIAGSDTEIQYNDTGSFGASSTFTFENALSTLSLASTTVTGNALSVTANSLETGGSGLTVSSSSTNVNARSLVVFTNSASAAVLTTVLEVQQSGGGTTAPAVKIGGSGDTPRLLIEGSATTATMFTMSLQQTTGSGLVIVGDALTTGSLAQFTSDSGNTSARNLVEIIQDNAAATLAVALKLQQDTVAQPVVEFTASDRGTATMTVSDQQASVRVSINGTTYRLALYTNA